MSVFAVFLSLISRFPAVRFTARLSATAIANYPQMLCNVVKKTPIESVTEALHYRCDEISLFFTYFFWYFRTY